MVRSQVDATQKPAGKEGNDDEDEVRRMEKEVTRAVLTADLVDTTTIGVLALEAEATCDVERSSSSVLAGEPFQHVHQGGDCSQVENEQEERDGWLAHG